MTTNQDTRWNLDLSIIIPVKDEAQNFSRLAMEIEAAMKAVSCSWECIWVDDGSTDDILLRIQKISEREPRHQFVSLSQNYGQAAAMFAGFCHARGEILATLDGDGQNDPADIPVLLNRLLKDNVDMVNGVRQKRKDNLIRKISSRIANSFRNRLTKESVTDVGCSLRVFKHRCVENILPFKGMHRFLPTLIRIYGYSKIIETPVRHRSRKYGETKYGIHNRLWVGIADTLAVRWMQARLVFPIVKNTSSNVSKKGNRKI